MSDLGFGKIRATSLFNILNACSPVRNTRECLVILDTRTTPSPWTIRHAYPYYETDVGTLAKALQRAKVIVLIGESGYSKAHRENVGGGNGGGRNGENVSKAGNEEIGKKEDKNNLQLCTTEKRDQNSLCPKSDGLACQIKHLLSQNPKPHKLYPTQYFQQCQQVQVGVVDWGMNSQLVYGEGGVVVLGLLESYGDFVSKFPFFEVSREVASVLRRMSSERLLLCLFRLLKGNSGVTSPVYVYSESKKSAPVESGKKKVSIACVTEKVESVLSEESTSSENNLLSEKNAVESVMSYPCLCTESIYLGTAAHLNRHMLELLHIDFVVDCTSCSQGGCPPPREVRGGLEILNFQGAGAIQTEAVERLTGGQKSLIVGLSLKDKHSLEFAVKLYKPDSHAARILFKHQISLYTLQSQL